MMNLQLDFDEGILLENKNASWESRKNMRITDLILTNKNIYCVFNKSNGLFKKATEEVNVLALADIKIINGQVLAQQIKHDGIWCLQIQFRQGTERFSFYESPKKVIPQWVDAINDSLGVLPNETVSESVLVPKSAKRSNLFGGVWAGAAGTLADVADSLKSAVDNAAESLKQSSDNSPKSEFDNEIIQRQEVVAPQSTETKKRQRSFCMNCGASLVPGAQFCSSCGSKVANKEDSSKYVVEKDTVTPPPIPTVQGLNITPPPIPTVQETNITPSPIPKPQRQQEYVGIVLKCPNCGAVIGETTVVCPECGMRITGRAAVTSVQEFKDQLMNIESGRKKAKFMDLYTQSANPTDKQKLSLIRSFPIPNTVDDILEFMFLAVANIDVKVSKNTATGKFTSMMNSGNVNLTMEKTISDAWVSKMQQAYQKAEIMFPDDKVFSGIQKLYFDKMKELKIKV